MVWTGFFCPFRQDMPLIGLLNLKNFLALLAKQELEQNSAFQVINFQALFHDKQSFVPSFHLSLFFGIIQTTCDHGVLPQTLLFFDFFLKDHETAIESASTWKGKCNYFHLTFNVKSWRELFHRFFLTTVLNKRVLLHRDKSTRSLLYLCQKALLKFRSSLNILFRS